MADEIADGVDRETATYNDQDRIGIERGERNDPVGGIDPNCKMASSVSPSSRRL